MSPHILINNASLRFRLYKSSANLKESFISRLRRGQSKDTVEDFDVLKDINLTFSAGDRVGIIGLNGAGKSTLLKMITGIYQPLSGWVEVRGNIMPLIELTAGFDPELSGRENIYLSGAILGRKREQIAEYEQDVVEFSELGDFINVPIKYYSSGMLGRLAFSVGTMCKPEILLVDEVLSTGDAEFVAKATNRMMDLLSSSQIVVLVSHNLDHVESLCNRAIILHQGRVVADGPPSEMIDYYLEEISKAAVDKGAAAIGQHGGGKLFQTARAAGQWTVPMKLQAVMDIIAGTRTIEQVAIEAKVETATVQTWLKNGTRGMRNGLRARPLTIEEQYQVQIDQLEKRVLALEEENARLRANSAEACGEAVVPLAQDVPSAISG